MNKTVEDINTIEKELQPSINSLLEGDSSVCDECGGIYTSRRHDQRFCSKDCRQKYHNDTYYAGRAARAILNLKK